MKTIKKLVAGLLFVVSICLFTNSSLLAASNTPINNQIIFNSFTGNYHLSRDSKGLSLLSSEEAILADFPSSASYYGITRQLPKKYQGHSVDIKVLSVSDAAGNAVPYKITSDNSDNLIITTGNPAITLYGSQTIKINYQTIGVINLNQENNEFLLNVNGRGWNQGFSKVNAFLTIPSSFQADLIGEPLCYTTINVSKNNDCQISKQKKSDEIVIASKAGPLQAHQALVLKLEFAKSTFTNNQAKFKQWQALALVLGIVVVIALIVFSKKSNVAK